MKDYKMNVYYRFKRYKRVQFQDLNDLAIYFGFILNDTQIQALQNGSLLIVRDMDGNKISLCINKEALL